MNPRMIAILTAAGVPLVLAVAGLLRADETDAEAPAIAPLDGFSHVWRDDPAWDDGKAEVAIYDATRTIYGKQRRYTARLYTNKEHANSETKTKDPGGRGRAVFKHHLRDDIPTENYTYHYSTMCYVGAEDLKSLKIDMGSQEDCGASFKQFINHNGTVTWNSFSYFPNEGHTSGSFESAANLVSHDALSLVLRSFPFNDYLPGADPPDPPVLVMLPDQTDNHQTDIALRTVSVQYKGRQFVHLPIGRVDTEHVVVTVDGSNDRHEYWFDFDNTAPRLNVMVQYKGPGGVSYKLRKHERSAYWKR